MTHGFPHVVGCDWDSVSIRAKPAPLWGSVAVTEAEIEAARKGRLVVRRGTFTGAHEVAEARGSDA